MRAPHSRDQRDVEYASARLDHCVVLAERSAGAGQLHQRQHLEALAKTAGLTVAQPVGSPDAIDPTDQSGSAFGALVVLSQRCR